MDEYEGYPPDPDAVEPEREDLLWCLTPIYQSLFGSDYKMPHYPFKVYRRTWWGKKVYTYHCFACGGKWSETFGDMMIELEKRFLEKRDAYFRGL